MLHHKRPAFRRMRASLRSPMNYLYFDPSENTDGVWTLEAFAATGAEQHAAVMAEVQQVLDWAQRSFPHGQGLVEDGMDWHHDLQVQVEDGHWHAVTLTLAGSARFAEAFLATFGDL